MEKYILNNRIKAHKEEIALLDKILIIGEFYLSEGKFIELEETVTYLKQHIKKNLIITMKNE